jgi:tRNA (uracil-5-)-methyltransferase TRM9
VDDATIRRLNAINRAFYAGTAAAFDETRQAAWPGWMRALPYLPAARPLRVLDIGCGNGRFGAFLAEALPDARIDYTGLDGNAALLGAARARLSAIPGVRLYLAQMDLIEAPPAVRGSYDIVAVLGFLHHVPAAELRVRLLRLLARTLAPGGVLLFTAWCFYESPRFRGRIVPWPDGLEVEDGDYLLDWRKGEVALRYCHYIDEAEHERLAAATGLCEAARYRADGRGGALNRYSVLLRPSPDAPDACH